LDDLSNFFPANYWSKTDRGITFPASPNADRGLTYLRSVEPFLPTEIVLDIRANLRDREVICTWIGNNIERVNAKLRDYVTACDRCFHPEDRQPVQIFATPLPNGCGLDGVCNLDARPVTILVDVGRVPPSDWLSLVVHEYTHAHLGKPGHDRDFADTLSHLCLGLGLEPPRELSEASLRSFPPYRSLFDPLTFWRGEDSEELRIEDDSTPNSPLPAKSE
jgi:hypothetical protein